MKNQAFSSVDEPELRNLKVFFFLMAFLLITDFVMPQYFGIHLGYDLTCIRLGDICIILYMIFNRKLFTHFCSTVMKQGIFIPIALYLLVAFYTMVLRTDLNAFFLVFFEMLTLLILLYGIRYVIGCSRAIRMIIGCAYFLSIYGMVEYVYGKSLFLQFLSTMPNNVANCYRSGHYRIMGPCGHPLGYGLLLLLFLAVASYDYERQEVYIFKRPLLFLLLIANIFLTGSRSTLGIVFLEIALLLVVSGKTNVKKSIFVLVIVVVVLALFLLLFQGTSVGRYMLMQLASLLDQLLGTQYAALFGADVTTLHNSEAYREFLPRIFTLDWLNPFLGRGVSSSFSAEIEGIYIHSIDNYYVSQYIKYAYPGLVTYCIFIIGVVVMMVRECVIYHSNLSKVLLIATVCYYVNLWWLDALQTLKFEYVIIALFFAEHAYHVQTSSRACMSNELSKKIVTNDDKNM